MASTATRARETAEIIYRHVSYLKIEWSDLLREGKPIYPEPPISWWDPNHEAKYFYVSYIKKLIS